jgi:hypothetical protein
MEEDPLPKFDVQYADYAIWQRQWMNREVPRGQGEYRKYVLAGTPTPASPTLTTGLQFFGKLLILRSRFQKVFTTVSPP